MIILLLLNFVLLIIGLIFRWLPVVTIADIPWIGPSVSSFLYTMVEVWNAFMVTFPYAQTAWHMLIVFIIPFEIGMLLLRLILGSRSPSPTN